MAVLLASVISAILLLFGTILTVLATRGTTKVNSVDKRIDTAFEANDRLIEQYQDEVKRLHEREQFGLARMGNLEESVNELRLLVMHQQEQLFRNSQDSAEMRVWAAKMTEWATRAKALLGGDIEEPPVPPEHIL
jgi:hypothetical protein